MLSYADNGGIIEKCKSELSKIQKLGMNFRNKERRISAKLVQDPVLFSELYDNLINPCIELICKVNVKRPNEAFLRMFLQENAILLLFLKDDAVSESEANGFLDYFRDFVKGLDPFGDALGGAVCQTCPDEAIRKAVNAELVNAPKYIRRRVELICLLLGKLPGEVFSETQWPRVFDPPRGKKYTLKVEDGMVFSLCLHDVRELIPRDLCNDSEQLCTIYVDYRESDNESGEESTTRFAVKIPPYSFVKALFADEKCEKLVSVKGNISCNSAKDKTIVIHHTGKGKLYTCYGNKAPICYQNVSNFLDASADGSGAAAVLQINGVFKTGTKQLDARQTPPIRVYGAGMVWAYQYADGRLETDPRYRWRLDRAYAVVEKGNSSLLVLNQSGAWDCNPRGVFSVKERDLVKAMFDRFQDPSCCETVTANGATLQINESGGLEVR